MWGLIGFFATLLLLGFSVPSNGIEIAQSRGADAQVRYDTLMKFGPWDDGNYQLTRADLELLAPNEEELRDPIPAFFRVELRRNNPTLPREGPAQYPRSALQEYLMKYGGYHVDGKVYKRVRLDQGQYQVLEEEVTDIPGRAANRFLSGEVRVTSPEGANESAIKINPIDRNLVIAGSNGPGGGQKMHFSTDGGDTWTQTTLPGGNTCCDPTVEWSSDGTLAYAATLGAAGGPGFGVWFYRSGDNGQTWTDLQNATPGDPRRELTNSGSDKEYLHVDKSPNSSFRDNIYLSWHQSNIQKFASSTDNGNTWTTLSFDADPRGIGSDITTDKNGNVYYFWPGTNSQQILLKKSTNGGTSFASGTTQVATTNGAFDFSIPSQESRGAWVYVSADADLSNGPFGGSIYAAWTDTTGPESSNNHTRIQVAFSRNGGSTWNVVTPHETADENTVDRWNQWLAVGEDGTVHVIFYDTRRDPSRTSVDIFHSFSTNGGQTFSSPSRLTADQSPNITHPQEFGDYNGLDVVMNDIITIFTDNREEGTGSGDSRDVYVRGIDHGEPTLDSDLSLIKIDDPDPVSVGNSLTYTLTVHNHGPETAKQVVLTDTLPNNVSFTSVTPTECTHTSNHITCNLGDLTKNASKTITILVKTVIAGSLSNTATVTHQGQDPNSGNNIATATTLVEGGISPPPSMICSAPGLDISKERGVEITDILEVSQSRVLTDLDVSLDISHTYVGDLVVTLEHEVVGPSAVLLHRSIFTQGNCQFDDIQVTLDDDADRSVQDTCDTNQPAIKGTLKPKEPLSSFNGKELKGSWKLRVQDKAFGDGGSLNKWCLIPTF